MRDRPAAANKVSKKTRHRSRGSGSSTKAKFASTTSKQAQKIRSALNESTNSSDSSVASDVEDDGSTLEQSKAPKPARGRPKTSKKRDAQNGEDDEEMSGLEDHSSNGDGVQRQLSELRKSYSKLEQKYQKLQEIGVKQAEQNFEQLKAQAEENTRGKAAPYHRWRYRRLQISHYSLTFLRDSGQRVDCAAQGRGGRAIQVHPASRAAAVAARPERGRGGGFARPAVSRQPISGAGQVRDEESVHETGSGQAWRNEQQGTYDGEPGAAKRKGKQTSRASQRRLVCGSDGPHREGCAPH